MNKRLKPIPKFVNEAAERAFWEKSDSTEYVDWKKLSSLYFQILSRRPKRSRYGFRSIFLIPLRPLPTLETFLINR